MKFLKKFNPFRYLPVTPPKTMLDLKKLNQFDYIANRDPYFWTMRVSRMQHLFKNYPYIPNEIWNIILVITMYYEKKDSHKYYDWFYSHYNRTLIEGMKLRRRVIYYPTIIGIIINEGDWIMHNLSKKLTVFNSECLLNYIVKWYHWLNVSCKYYTDLKHIIHYLKMSPSTFITNTPGKMNFKMFTNFSKAHYYTNVYYDNFIKGELSFYDFDFETMIFYKDYYKRVYEKSMMLRNGKRINMFLHE